MSRRTRLTEQQRQALELAHRAREIGSKEGLLICAYGNTFFIAGGTEPDGTCERSTLKSLHRRGWLLWSPGLAARGEYRLSHAGLEIVRSMRAEVVS